MKNARFRNKEGVDTKVVNNLFGQTSTVEMALVNNYLEVENEAGEVARKFEGIVIVAGNTKEEKKILSRVNEYGMATATVTTKGEKSRREKRGNFSLNLWTKEDIKRGKIIFDQSKKWQKTKKTRGLTFNEDEPKKVMMGLIFSIGKVKNSILLSQNLRANDQIEIKINVFKGW